MKTNQIILCLLYFAFWAIVAYFLIFYAKTKLLFGFLFGSILLLFLFLPQLVRNYPKLFCYLLSISAFWVIITIGSVVVNWL